jgi:hypothetical protein
MFSEFVRKAQQRAVLNGIQLPMGKMFDAIAIACYGKAYSAVIAAESAGKLPKPPFPASNIPKAAAQFRIDEDALRHAIEAIGIDLFDDKNHPFVLSPNVWQYGKQFVVVTSAGSGKGWQMSALITSYVLNGGRVIVLDSGGSYRHLCQCLSGHWNEVSLGNPTQWTNHFVVLEWDQHPTPLPSLLDDVVRAARAEPELPCLVLIDESEQLHRWAGSRTVEREFLLALANTKAAVGRVVHDLTDPSATFGSDTSLWMLRMNRSAIDAMPAMYRERLGINGIEMLKNVSVSPGRSEVLISRQGTLQCASFSASAQESGLYSTALPLQQ